MLQVSFLRDEKERVLEGLKKRNFKNLELVDEAIKLDDERKKTQQEIWQASYMNWNSIVCPRIQSIRQKKLFWIILDLY